MKEMTWKLEKKTFRWKYVESLEPPRVVHIRTTEMLSKENVYAQVTVRLLTRQVVIFWWLCICIWKYFYFRLQTNSEGGWAQVSSIPEHGSWPLEIFWKSRCRSVHFRFVCHIPLCTRFTYFGCLHFINFWWQNCRFQCIRCSPSDSGCCLQERSRYIAALDVVWTWYLPEPTGAPSRSLLAAHWLHPFLLSHTAQLPMTLQTVLFCRLWRWSRPLQAACPPWGLVWLL